MKMAEIQIEGRYIARISRAFVVVVICGPPTAGRFPARNTHSGRRLWIRGSRLRGVACGNPGCARCLGTGHVFPAFSPGICGDDYDGWDGTPRYMWPCPECVTPEPEGAKS